MARHVNWAAVVFTSGSAITISEVVDLQFDERNDIIRGKGDVALFATRVDVVGIGRTARVTTENPGVVATLEVGMVGTLAGVFKSAGKHGPAAEAGDLVLSLGSAKVVRLPFGGRHAQYGQATVEWEAYSADGATDPLTVTIQGA